LFHRYQTANINTVLSLGDPFMQMDVKRRIDIFENSQKHGLQPYTDITAGMDPGQPCMPCAHSSKNLRHDTLKFYRKMKNTFENFSGFNAMCRAPPPNILDLPLPQTFSLPLKKNK
jgi:hypothetical protein